MKTLINRLLDYQIKNNCIEKSEKAVYEYAYTILIEECINIVVAFIIGILFGNVMLVLGFLCSYIPLRRFAGGYHADNGIACGIVSAILIIILCFLSKVNIWDLSLVQKNKYIILTISQICVFILAPIDTENKKLNEYEKKKYHMIVAKILIAQMFVANIITLLNINYLFGGIIYSHIVLNCMLFMGIYKNHILRHTHFVCQEDTGVEK